MEDADDIIHSFLKSRMEFLEQQILQKGKLLDFFMELNRTNGNNLVSDQIGMITTDLQELIDELMKIRKDGDHIYPDVGGIIDKMGNIKPISREKLLKNLKNKYYWQG